MASLYILWLQDQFDTIDFSNNEIRRLDGFPYLQRLRSVIINNNKIKSVRTGLTKQIINLILLMLYNVVSIVCASKSLYDIYTDMILLYFIVHSTMYLSFNFFSPFLVDSRIGVGLGEYLPQLETLVLTYNNLEELVRTGWEGQGRGQNISSDPLS